jgi:hypothetical protein
LPGFTQGTGIPVNGVNLPYTLNGLGANTSYAYFVRTVCGQNNTSGWAGPFVFTTTNNAGISTETMGFKVYPNPFKQSFTLQYPEGRTFDCSLKNVLGQEVPFAVKNNGVGVSTIEVLSECTGMYILEILTEGGKVVTRMTKD